MDIFNLDQELIARYSLFARSFSEIRAPELKQQVDAGYASGRFWPEPLITINPKFEQGRSVIELAKAGILDEATAQVFAAGDNRTPITLHRHQERAVVKAAESESFIVTTGTGSGKSLCFFLPLVDRIIRAKRAGEAQKTRAIIIYPMNALANSQLEELDKFVSESELSDELKPTYKRYTGQESEDERRKIGNSAPDILLTNFMMLELLMTRQDEVDRSVIQNAEGLEFLVLDELHTYRGRQGADVAMLVRRVRERLCGKKPLLCIGTSATMSSAEDEIDRAKAVAEVGSKLFGQPVKTTSIIDEHLVRATDTSVRIATLGENLRTAVETPVPQNLSDSELRVHPLACWIELEIGLDDSEKLRRRKPITLSDAAKKLTEKVGLDEARCAEAIAEMLQVMGRRENLRGGQGDRAFLAFKLHRFISGAGQAFATLEPVATRRVVLDAQVFHPEDGTARLYPLYFCRECGQEHHSVTLEATPDGRRFLARPIDEQPNEEATDERNLAGFLVPAVNADFQFDGEVTDYPEDWLEIKSDRPQLKSVHRKKHEGALYYVRPDGRLADDGIPAWFFRGKYRFCPHCRHQPTPQARDINKLAGLSGEGRSSATTLVVSTLLASMKAEGTLDAYTRKLLGFTDNRQDAALQAGHFNDFIFVTLLRSAILKAARENSSRGLSDSKFGDVHRHHPIHINGLE